MSEPEARVTFLETCGSWMPDLYVFAWSGNDRAWLPFRTGDGGALKTPNGSPVWTIAQPDTRYRLLVSDVDSEEERAAARGAVVPLREAFARDWNYVRFPGYGWPEQAFWNPTSGTFLRRGDVHPRHEPGLTKLNQAFRERAAMTDYFALGEALLDGVTSAVGLPRVTGILARHASESLARSLARGFATKLVQNLLVDWVVNDEEDGRFARAFLRASVATLIGRISARAVPDLGQNIGLAALADQLKSAVDDRLAEPRVDGLERLLSGEGRFQIRRFSFSGRSVRGFAVLDRFQGGLSLLLHVRDRADGQHLFFAEGGPGTLPLAGTETAPLSLSCDAIELPDEEPDDDAVPLLEESDHDERYGLRMDRARSAAGAGLIEAEDAYFQGRRAANLHARWLVTEVDRARRLLSTSLRALVRADNERLRAAHSALRVDAAAVAEGHGLAARYDACAEILARLDGAARELEELEHAHDERCVSLWSLHDRRVVAELRGDERDVPPGWWLRSRPRYWRYARFLEEGVGEAVLNAWTDLGLDDLQSAQDYFAGARDRARIAQLVPDAITAWPNDRAALYRLLHRRREELPQAAPAR